MKITLNHNKFAKYLQYTSRAVSHKPNIPILSNVKFEVTKNNLQLSATNLEMGIDMWIPGVVQEEGKVTVSAKYIADFVAATTADKVDISLEDNVLLVQTAKSKANFTIIPADEFPVLPTLPENKLFSISAKEFITTLEKITFSCSTDLSAGKIQQSGVLFELDEEKDNEISFVGLDGFRLSKRNCEVKDLNKAGVDSQIIVPARYLNELVKIISDFENLEEINVYLSENKSQIIFQFEEVEFSIRLLEGPYPDYKRIMPDSYSYSFQVKKSELEDALKVISTFARSNLAYKTLFDMDLENSLVKFKSVVNEVGENETIVEVENIQGESDLNTAYNLRYLQDVVSHMQGQKIKFESKGPLAASVFKDLSDENYVHLLMPLRREV